MRFKLSKEQCEKAIREIHRSDANLALEFGCSRTTVWAFRKKAGVKSLASPGGRRRSLRRWELGADRLTSAGYGDEMVYSPEETI